MATRDIKKQIADALYDMLRLKFVGTARSSIDPASINAEASGDTTVTVAGALLGDYVLVGWETDVLTGVNLAAYAFVSAADTVTVHLSNINANGGAAINVAAVAVQVTVLRRA